MDQGNGVKNGKDTGTKQVNRVANHEPLSGFSCVSLLPGRACGGVVCTCACAARPASRTCGFSALPRTLSALRAGGARNPRRGTTRFRPLVLSGPRWLNLLASSRRLSYRSRSCFLPIFMIFSFKLCLTVNEYLGKLAS